MKRYTDKRGLGRGEEGKQAGKEIRKGRKKRKLQWVFSSLGPKNKNAHLNY